MTLTKFVALLGTIILTMSTPTQALADGTKSDEEQRWSKVVPEVRAVVEQRWHLTRTIPAQDAHEVDQYKYWRATPEPPDKVYKFRQAVENSHKEYQQRTREVRHRWTVGLKYAQDVYVRELGPVYKNVVQYKYDVYTAKMDWPPTSLRWEKTGETEWGERQTTGSLDVPPQWPSQTLLVNEQNRTEKVQTGMEWKYRKVVAKGDRHPSLYGPYDVFADPTKVSFVVGSTPRLVGQAFHLGEYAYDAAGNSIGIQYVYRLVAGPVNAGYTDWSGWPDYWSVKNPGKESSVKQVRTRTVKDPDTWIYLDGNLQKTADQAKAAWHQTTEAIEDNNWEAFTSQELPQTTVYLMADGDSTPDAEKAAWINTPPDEMNNWSPVLDDQGEPVVNTVETRPASPERTVYLSAIGLEVEDKAEAGWFTATNDVSSADWTKIDEEPYEVSPKVPEHTVYYVPGGEPTKTLGESNWTTDVPSGWTLVDTRRIGSSGSSNEPGIYTPYNIVLIFVGVVGALLALGLGAIAFLRRRIRPKAPVETLEGVVLDPLDFIDPSTRSSATTYVTSDEDIFRPRPRSVSLEKYGRGR